MTSSAASTDTFTYEYSRTQEFLVMQRVAEGPWRTLADDRPFTSREWAERSLRLNEEETAEQVRVVEDSLAHEGDLSAGERTELTELLVSLRRTEHAVFVREVGPLRRA